MTTDDHDPARIEELAKATGLTPAQVRQGLPLAELLHQASFHLSQDQIDIALAASGLST